MRVQLNFRIKFVFANLINLVFKNILKQIENKKNPLLQIKEKLSEKTWIALFEKIKNIETNLAIDGNRMNFSMENENGQFFLIIKINYFRINQKKYLQNFLQQPISDELTFFKMETGGNYFTLKYKIQK